MPAPRPSEWPVRRRLLIGIGTIIGSFILLTLATGVLTQQVETAGADAQQLAAASATIEGISATMVTIERDLLRGGEASSAAQTRSSVDAARASTQGQLADLVFDERGEQLRTQTELALGVAFERAQRVLDVLDDRGAAAATTLLAAEDGLVDTDLERTLAGLRDHVDAGAQQRADTAATLAAANTRTASIATLMILLAAGGLGWWLTRSISGALRTASIEVDRETDELAATARGITSDAEATAAQAGVVAAAGEQVSAGAHTVASGVEQLRVSVEEITRSVTTATDIAADATNRAQHTATLVGQLDEASNDIGQVVELISSIAAQTDLLALNATIEAARAGDAGKGFAVVAGEVKGLANESATATVEIGERIHQMRERSTAAVATIGSIVEVIDQIADAQRTIASAVEEQSAATSEIARTIHEAATGSAQIATNIADVATAASATSQATASITAATDRLTATSDRLRQLVDGRSGSPRRSVPTIDTARGTGNRQTRGSSDDADRDLAPV